MIAHLRMQMADIHPVTESTQQASSANVNDLMALQREARVKGSQVVLMETKYTILETKYLAVRDQHEVIASTIF